MWNVECGMWDAEYGMWNTMPVGRYLAEQHGEPAVGAMRAIKLALDPRNLMNPGKVVCCGPPAGGE